MHHLVHDGARRQRDRCRPPLICDVRDGHLDEVRLDGLGFIMVVDSPAIMGEGGWRVALYIDERADERQRQALGAILGGEHGGVPAALAPLIGEMLGVKFVPIHYESKGLHGRYDDPDHGLAFDNTGKNGHYREFAWEA